MSSEAEKPLTRNARPASVRRARVPARSRVSGSYRTQKAALDAIRTHGDQFVSLTVSWTDDEAHHVAIGLPGREAAALVKAAIRKSAAVGKGELQPNAELAKALEEGRTLKGRFSSARELFDGLEAESGD